MKRKVLIPLITVLCITGMAHQQKEADTSKAIARKMEQDAKTDPEFQRHRKQFEAFLRGLENDFSLRVQREKIQSDIKAAEGSPAILLQKSNVEADLKEAERSPGRAEQMKRQQRDIEKTRETSLKKAER